MLSLVIIVETVHHSIPKIKVFYFTNALFYCGADGENRYITTLENHLKLDHLGPSPINLLLSYGHHLLTGACAQIRLNFIHRGLPNIYAFILAE